MNQYYSGVALILLSALGFGLMPIFAIFTFREGVNVMTLLLLRFSIAAVILLLYLKLNGKKIAVSRRQLGMLFILGSVLYSCQSSFYFSAVRYIPASLAVLLLYTYPVFVAILSAIVDKERLSRSNILAIVLSTAGLALALGAAPAAVSPWGIALALAAAVIYSAYIVIGNRVVKQSSPLVTSAFVTVFAAISLFVGGTASGSLNFSLSLNAWLALAGIVGFSTIMAMLTLFRGMELIGPTRASILSMIEPLITFGFSALFFAERLTLIQIAGGIAVLAGAVIVVQARGQAADKPESVPETG